MQRCRGMYSKWQCFSTWCWSTGTYNTSGQIHGGGGSRNDVRMQDLRAGGWGGVSKAQALPMLCTMQPSVDLHSLYGHRIVIIFMITFLRPVPFTSKDAAILQPCEKKWGLTTEQILQWENRWSTTPKPCAQENFIPKFELATENDKPHLVVILNGMAFYAPYIFVGSHAWDILLFDDV